MAAVTFTNKTSGSDIIDGATLVTASVAFQNNRLYLVSVAARGATDPNINSITGGGITWVEMQEVITVSPRVAMYRGRVTSGATTEALTITLAADGQGVWSIDESDGTEDTSGTDGSGAIVQSAKASGSGTSGSVTLSAFADAANNTCFACFAHAQNEVHTHEAGFTELVDVAAGGTRIHALMTEYKGGQDLNPSATWVTSRFWGGVAVEVKSGGAGAPVVTRRSLLGVGV